jgi:hypothetical protein
MAASSGSRQVAQSHLELEERIRQRAYELYQQRGGNELDNWLEAEREVLGKSRQPAQDRGTTVGDARKPSRALTESLGSA